MTLALTIGGASKGSVIQQGTLVIVDQLAKRNTASFGLAVQAATFRPQVGSPVVITQDGSTVYAGTIDDYEQTRPGPASVSRYSLNCVDYNQIADRHLVASAFDGVTCGSIMSTILGAALAGEGVSAGTISAGPTIAHIVFNYRTAADCFDELARVSGYTWWIDYTKHLQFVLPGGVTAPFTLTDTSINWRNMMARRSRGTYRNRQFVRAGKDTTAARTESFHGDGKTRTFTLAYATAKAPTSVKVNTVSKTLGIKNVDAGYDWYWSGGDKEIIQDAGGAVLGTGDTLDVTYQGLYPLICVAPNVTEIKARKAVEGGTGVYEAVLDRQEIDQRAQALALARGMLRRYARILTTVTFETESAGLSTGQMLPITNTELGLSGSYLITQVRISELNNQKLTYRVTAVDGY